MEKSEVLGIYQKNKEEFFRELTGEKEPVAVFTGGQPASGKGSLKDIVGGAFPDKRFLLIDGDQFRKYHPDFNRLIQGDPVKYTRETQVFCGTMKEELMKDCIQNRYNFICEGTMRDVESTKMIAESVRKQGYRVEVHAVAAHPDITNLGLHRRYCDELLKSGAGRLATMNYEAAKGLPNALDKLYMDNAADKIVIYSQESNVGRQALKDPFHLKKKIEINHTAQGWDNRTLPSFFVEQSRQEQNRNPALLLSNIKAAESTLAKLASEVATRTAGKAAELLSVALGKVKIIYQALTSVAGKIFDSEK